MRCRTDATLELAALFALFGDGKGVMESLVALVVHSLQLSSDADLLRCFRSDEQRDSRFNLDFSSYMRVKREEKKVKSLCSVKWNYPEYRDGFDVLMSDLT